MMKTTEGTTLTCGGCAAVSPPVQSFAFAAQDWGWLKVHVGLEVTPGADPVTREHVVIRCPRCGGQTAAKAAGWRWLSRVATWDGAEIPETCAECPKEPEIRREDIWRCWGCDEKAKTEGRTQAVAS